MADVRELQELRELLARRTGERDEARRNAQAWAVLVQRAESACPGVTRESPDRCPRCGGLLVPTDSPHLVSCLKCARRWPPLLPVQP